MSVDKKECLHEWHYHTHIYHFFDKYSTCIHKELALFHVIAFYTTYIGAYQRVYASALC